MERFKSKINIETDKWGEMIISLKDDDGKIINYLSGWYRKDRQKECKQHLAQLRKEYRTKTGQFYKPNLTDILNA